MDVAVTLGTGIQEAWSSRHIFGCALHPAGRALHDSITQPVTVSLLKEVDSIMVSMNVLPRDSRTRPGYSNSLSSRIDEGLTHTTVSSSPAPTDSNHVLNPVRDYPDIRNGSRPTETLNVCIHLGRQLVFKDWWPLECSMKASATLQSSCDQHLYPPSHLGE